MKFLDQKNNLIFKKIFDEQPNILKHFLNALLPLKTDRTIESLKYFTPELVPETFLEKFSVVDARCTDNYGQQFIVEMQMSWSEVFRSRVIFNASKAFVNQTVRIKPATRICFKFYQSHLFATRCQLVPSLPNGRTK